MTMEQRQTGVHVAVGFPRRRALIVALAFVASILASRLIAQRGDATRAERGRPPSQAAVADKPWQVEQSRPAGPPRVATGELDPLGQPVTVSCASCHASLEPNYSITSGEQLAAFHQGLRFHHRGLSCLSCHNPDDYNQLRLADGRAVEYTEVQTLCGQCHAPQARDFDRGAHGGMTGYWDLSRGPRVRKNCIDCHDPHAPAFPTMMPTFKPHDRFLEPPAHGHGAAAEVLRVPLRNERGTP